MDITVMRMKRNKTDVFNYCLRKTMFGPVVILWSVYRNQPNILRILLSNEKVSAKQAVKTLWPGSIPSSCADIDTVADQIAAFLTGEDIRFSLNSARLALCSGFQQKVLRAEYKIPRGYVSTYQRIAQYIGKPSSARAVGTSLAKNPFPILIPCHRVIRRDGTFGGYQGGFKMKRALLAMEGLKFNTSGQIAERSLLYL